MKEWQSMAHVTWDCKYHVVIVSKYRKTRVYGKQRRRIGEVLRELCHPGFRLATGDRRSFHV